MVVTDSFFLWTAGNLRFGRNWHYIIFQGIILGLIFFKLSEIWRELALHYFWAECFGGSRLGGDGQIVMTFRQLSQIWQELALHYFPVDCFGGIQFGGDGLTIFTDSRLSETWRELALHYFSAECFGIDFF